MIDVARVLLRTVQRRAGLGALLVRAGDIRVGAADQELRVGIDAGNTALDLGVRGDPGLEGLGVAARPSDGFGP